MREYIIDINNYKRFVRLVVVFIIVFIIFIVIFIILAAIFLRFLTIFFNKKLFFNIKR